MGKIKNAILNRVTKATLKKVNARLNAWQKSPDIDDETIQAFKKHIASIEGVSFDKKGKVIVDKDLNIYGRNTLQEAIPTMTQLKKNIKQLDKEFADIKFENEKERRQAMAELSFKMEVKRFKNEAMDDLWELYYEDHDAKRGNRIINQKLYGLREDIRSDIGKDMEALGKAIANGTASAEDVREMVESIELARGGKGKYYEY